MSATYYDDAIVIKLKKWIPENSSLRVLKPDETKRLFSLMAEDKKDKPMTFPFIALSRNSGIGLPSPIKQTRSFDGYKKQITSDLDKTAQLNAIPIGLQYQLDIYTKTVEEGDEYLRLFLFKLINNPDITIEIPYNNLNEQHISHIRLLDQADDTSDIGERLYSGQFTRWTLQLELQDAFLYDLPYRRNWRLNGLDLEITSSMLETGELEKVLVEK